MAKQDRNIDIPHCFLTRIKEGSGEPDFTITLNGAYDVTKHLEAWLAEAGVKGCVLYLTAQLIEAEKFFQADDNPEESEELEDG